VDVSGDDISKFTGWSRGRGAWPALIGENLAGAASGFRHVVSAPRPTTWRRRAVVALEKCCTDRRVESMAVRPPRHSWRRESRAKLVE